MSRKAQLTLGLLVLLMLFIVTASALPKITNPGNSFNFGIKAPALPEYQPYPGWNIRDNSIMVTHCQKGFYWSDINKGDSICTLPSGQIKAGDMITNCQGQVILTHIPSNSVIFTHYFTTRNTQTNPNNKNNSTPGTSEEKPTINIVKPVEKSLYLRNIKLTSTQITRIIGFIDIEIEINNPSNIEITYLKYYIDNELKHTDETLSLHWRWDEKIKGEHTIKVEAYTSSNEKICSTELVVSILNLQLL